MCVCSEPPGPPTPKVIDWTRSSVELEWIPPLLDGGSKVTGYVVEFKEVNKEEEEKKAQRRLLLSDTEEKEPDSDEGWEKVKNKAFLKIKWKNCDNFLICLLYFC